MPTLPLGVEPRAAEYFVLSLAAPGVPEQNIGIILCDRAGGKCDLKVMEHPAGLAPGLEPEECEALEGLAAQLSIELREDGAETVLRRLEDSLSHTVRITGRRAVAVRGFEYQLDRLFEKEVLGVVREAQVLPFERHLPVYSLRAAAGRFGEDMEVEPEGWVEAPERMRLYPDMFVAHIVGHSMEPIVPDGSLAIFRANPAGSRSGMTVLVWRRGAAGSEFTLKRYTSRKVYHGDEWEHEGITLKPANAAYQDLELEPGQYAVLGQLIGVLPGDTPVREG